MAIEHLTGFNQANSHRLDPFKNFRFRVFFTTNLNSPIIAVSKVSGLKRTTEVVSHRDGGDVSTPRHAPGRTSFEPITLERGITFANEFEDWANLVYNPAGGGNTDVSLKGYKRDLVIRAYNLQDTVVKSYTVYHCWISSYTALPDLDANANATMMESIIVQNEGWERDTTIVETPET
jgi:phage tail-like protein